MLEVLLLLQERIQHVRYLQRIEREGVVTLPEVLLAPSVVGVHVQVVVGDDMHQILQSILIHSDGS